MIFYNVCKLGSCKCCRITKGIVTCKFNKQRSIQLITVDATATGTVGKLNEFWYFICSIPEGVANSNVKATAAVDGVTLTKNVKDGVLTLAFVAYAR